MDEINIGQDKEKAIFSLFFGKNKETKIPVYFEIGEYKLYSLLDRKYLNISDFADFENLQNEELTIYTKIEKVDNSNNEVEIVDLFKDVLGLNRAMRRNINSNNNSNNNSTANFSDKIVLNGKTIKSSIIALLK